jgi:1-pyrroline-5-carboxylate dehydrogenase
LHLPIFQVYVYDDADYEKTLELIDSTSPYALTGAM